jgi:hypothetical protein
MSCATICYQHQACSYDSIVSFACQPLHLEYTTIVCFQVFYLLYILEILYRINYSYLTSPKYLLSILPQGQCHNFPHAYECRVLHLETHPVTICYTKQSTSSSSLTFFYGSNQTRRLFKDLRSHLMGNNTAFNFQPMSNATILDLPIQRMASLMLVSLDSSRMNRPLISVTIQMPDYLTGAAMIFLVGQRRLPSNFNIEVLNIDFCLL